MKQKYVSKALGKRKLAMIEQANAIIAEYQAEGLSLTLRQLYYQFVSRDMIANSQKEYKRLGNTINDGRLCGLIDWEAVEDRGRNVNSTPHWEDTAEIVAASAEQFAVDKWRHQEHRVEVWVEKEALIGVVETVCRQLDVACFACKGYVSQSEMWNAAMRVLEYIEAGQEPHIIHLGDHDPSGIDMTRDIRERLSLFVSTHSGTTTVDVHRIALNLDQIDEYDPPPNPAKVADTRFGEYAARFGRQSWELDALEPKVLTALIESTVLDYCDLATWDEAEAQESAGRAQLLELAQGISGGRWD